MIWKGGDSDRKLGTDRVYAVKGRSKSSFGVLSSMTVVQLAYGAVYIAVFRRKGENIDFI